MQSWPRGAMLSKLSQKSDVSEVFLLRRTASLEVWQMRIGLYSRKTQTIAQGQVTMDRTWLWKANPSFDPSPSRQLPKQIFLYFSAVSVCEHRHVATATVWDVLHLGAAPAQEGPSLCRENHVSVCSSRIQAHKEKLFSSLFWLLCNTNFLCQIHMRFLHFSLVLKH